jgi:4-diphosphocytidyl-2-C-methyl-D-erythritol kinase
VIEVTGRRDDGYHDIDTVLQTLELADDVVVRDGAPAGVTVSGAFAPGTPADGTNLAWRGAELLAARCGQSVDDLAIHLEKRIPAAGGLGGGASDAVTTLQLLQRAWPGATDAMVADIAGAIGSDEMFFLTGGTARARGRGERVTTLPSLPRRGVVLFVPHTTIEKKTPRMFAALDRLPFDAGGLAQAFTVEPPRPFASVDVYNAFERVAFDLFDGLATLWEALERSLSEPVRLAGAGPVLFWIGDPRRTARIAAAASGCDCTVISTATAGPS